MSQTTDVLIIHPSADRIVSEVNDRLRDHQKRDGYIDDEIQRFAKMDGAGGHKVLCTDVWAAAFNYLRDDWMLTILQSALTAWANLDRFERRRKQADHHHSRGRGTDDDRGRVAKLVLEEKGLN